jgi:outer membrane protein OmpA-like peptidoglycan-associated protein
MKNLLLLALFTIFSLSSFAQAKPNKYKDSEIIKLSNYILELEKKDSVYKAMQYKLEQAEREKNELKASLEKKDSAPVLAATNSTLEGYAKMLHYHTASATIRPESINILDGIYDIINLTNAKISIEGHTDNIGSSEMNYSLSTQRAQYVQAYLISKGLDPARITATGKGTEEPIGSNDTEEGRAKNRRVTITVVN